MIPRCIPSMRYQCMQVAVKYTYLELTPEERLSVLLSCDLATRGFSDISLGKEQVHGNGENGDIRKQGQGMEEEELMETCTVRPCCSDLM